MCEIRNGDCRVYTNKMSTSERWKASAAQLVYSPVLPPSLLFHALLSALQSLLLSSTRVDIPELELLTECAVPVLWGKAMAVLSLAMRVLCPRPQVLAQAHTTCWAVDLKLVLGCRWRGSTTGSCAG